MPTQCSTGPAAALSCCNCIASSRSVSAERPFFAHWPSIRSPSWSTKSTAPRPVSRVAAHASQGGPCHKQHTHPHTLGRGKATRRPQHRHARQPVEAFLCAMEVPAVLNIAKLDICDDAKREQRCTVHGGKRPRACVGRPSTTLCAEWFHLRFVFSSRSSSYSRNSARLRNDTFSKYVPLRMWRWQQRQRVSAPNTITHNPDMRAYIQLIRHGLVFGFVSLPVNLALLNRRDALRFSAHYTCKHPFKRPHNTTRVSAKTHIPAQPQQRTL